MLRGIKNYKDVGKVTEVNGKTKLDIWGEGNCNEFNGTDSTIFAPLLTEQDEIVSFAPDICRSMGARFDSYTQVKGRLLYFNYNFSFNNDEYTCRFFIFAT